MIIDFFLFAVALVRCVPLFLFLDSLPYAMRISAFTYYLILCFALVCHAHGSKQAATNNNNVPGWRL